jgi:hypothetical protein
MPPSAAGDGALPWLDRVIERGMINDPFSRSATGAWRASRETYGFEK